jgi:methionyl-tRNA synthetase
MIQRYCDGTVPAPGALVAADDALLASARGLLDKLRVEYAEQAFNRALELTWQVVAEANRYVDEQAPWALRRTDEPRMATVLYVLAETLRHLAVLTQPIVPDAAERLLGQLAQPPDRRSFAALAAHPLAPGTVLPKPEGIFPRIVEA